MELDKRSARICDGHIGQALAEHVFACARWRKTVAVSAVDAIVAMEHVGCNMRRLTEAISSDLARVALWSRNHLGIAVARST